jgi:hypothetical protein
MLLQPLNPRNLATVLLLALFFTNGKINTVLGVLADGSLFTWAWMELFQGVNYFRRLLGLAVFIGIIGSKLMY